VTELREAVREGSPPETAAAPGDAESAQRAKSITRTDSIAFQAVTQSARTLFRGGVAALTALDRAGSLPDAQPKTMRQAWTWHRRCAAHCATVLRWPRQLWGAVHVTTVKPALNFAEWITESPIRMLVTYGVIALVRHKVPLPEVTWWP
jgi:hypothetical protein